MAIVHCDFNETWYSIAFVRVGLDFMSRNVALAARKNQVTSFNFSPCHILQVAFYNFQVVSWYQFTTNCGYTDLAQACLNFIKWASIWNTSCQSLLHTCNLVCIPGGISQWCPPRSTGRTLSRTLYFSSWSPVISSLRLSIACDYETRTLKQQKCF